MQTKKKEKAETRKYFNKCFFTLLPFMGPSQVCLLSIQVWAVLLNPRPYCRWWWCHTWCCVKRFERSDGVEKHHIRNGPFTVLHKWLITLQDDVIFRTACSHLYWNVEMMSRTCLQVNSMSFLRLGQMALNVRGKRIFQFLDMPGVTCTSLTMSSLQTSQQVLQSDPTPAGDSHNTAASVQPMTSEGQQLDCAEIKLQFENSRFKS